MMGEFNNQESWFPGYMCVHVHKPCGHMAMLKVIGNMATMKQDAVSITCMEHVQSHVYNVYDMWVLCTDTCMGGDAVSQGAILS